MGREIVATVSVECALTMSAASVTRALHQEGPAPIDLPRRHPLMAYLFDGAASGPIPAVVSIDTFTWTGGELSVLMLRRFAALTDGRARFLLVDGKGRVRGFEIERGRLHVCEVQMETKRRRTR